MSEPYNYIGAICQVSGNPCGTDTHAKGYPCQCAPCRAIDRIALLEKVCEAVKAVLLRYDIESDELDDALRAADYLEEPAP